jgi:anti-anti-sigma factor
MKEAREASAIILKQPSKLFKRTIRVAASLMFEEGLLIPGRVHQEVGMIIQRTVGANAHLKVSGVVDNAHAPEFSNTLADLTQRGCQQTVLDLSDVPMICSAAIGSLILFFRAQKRLGREAKIEGIHQSLRNLFVMLRLDEVFRLDTEA